MVKEVPTFRIKNRNEMANKPVTMNIPHMIQNLLP